MTINAVLLAVGGAIFAVIIVAALLTVFIMNVIFGKNFGMKKQDPVTKEYEHTPESAIATLVSIILWASISVGLFMLFGSLLSR